MGKHGRETWGGPVAVRDGAPQPGERIETDYVGRMGTGSVVV